MLEGALPFLWLPIWWFAIKDHPREAKWISAAERQYLETTLQTEIAQLDSPANVSRVHWLREPSLATRLVLSFLPNSAAYGCMTFFTSVLKDRGYSALQYGILFAVPYAVTAIMMVLNSWHSDKTNERHGHIAAVYFLSGSSLILSVLLREHFWLSYGLPCLAI